MMVIVRPMWTGHACWLLKYCRHTKKRDYWSIVGHEIKRGWIRRALNPRNNFPRHKHWRCIMISSRNLILKWMEEALANDSQMIVVCKLKICIEHSRTFLSTLWACNFALFWIQSDKSWQFSYTLINSAILRITCWSEDYSNFVSHGKKKAWCYILPFHGVEKQSS